MFIMLKQTPEFPGKLGTVAFYINMEFYRPFSGYLENSRV